jgi:hypothetical protein
MSRRPSYGKRRSEGGPMPRVLLVIISSGLVARGVAPFAPPRTSRSARREGIGARTPVTVTGAEPPRGLTGVKVEFVQGDRTETIVAKTYTPASVGFWGKPTSSDAQVRARRDVQKNLKQLPATIRVTATRAGSWLRHPAPVVRDRPPVQADPPSLAVASSFTAVSQGGCEAGVHGVGETS